MFCGVENTLIKNYPSRFKVDVLYFNAGNQFRNENEGRIKFMEVKTIIPIEGMEIQVMQHPFGTSAQNAFGKITRIERNSRKGIISYINHDAHTEAGSSGSPVLTPEGQLIAIHAGYKDRINNINTAIPITVLVKEFDPVPIPVHELVQSEVLMGLHLFRFC